MYSEIIKRNKDIAGVRWWPSYAYHFTDINNAASILASGRLYSRMNASTLQLMKNDNASRQVIDMTNAAISSYVRFYFRPLTPTQYYNEGFKHNRLRYDNDVNANVPVPVFLVFNLNKILSDPKTMFSGMGQAGSGSVLYNNVEDFRNLDFAKIYGAGIPSKEDVPYRHAEIVYPNYYDIDKSITGIACRNDTERQSLCNLLWVYNHKAFYKYKKMISVMKDDMFENNGLFVSECDYSEGTFGVRFSNTKNKRDYEQFKAKRDLSIALDELKVLLKVTFDWKNRDRVIAHNEVVKETSYCDTVGYVFSNIPQINGAKELYIKIYIEDKLMSFMKYQLSSSEVL